MRDTVETYLPTGRQTGRPDPKWTVFAVQESSAEAFENQGDTLTAADAHRRQPPLLVVEAQRVRQRARDPGTGHAERVADRDRAAIDVQPVEVDAQVARRRDDLRR